MSLFCLVKIEFFYGLKIEFFGLKIEFMTYFHFCVKYRELLQQLRQRFFESRLPQAIINDKLKVKKWQEDVQKRIQLKVLKAVRDWMKKFWAEDFYQMIN